MDYGSQGSQAFGVTGLRNPQFKIASFIIFLGHMLTSALPMALLIKFRVMLESVLNGTQNDAFRDNLPVSLGNDLSVNGSWLMVR